jgi:uroporphyrinogen III methyltransferase/synthase
LAAVGEETARATRDQLSLKVDLCPNQFVAEALADALQQSGEVAGKRFLLLRADIGRPILAQRLKQDGAALIRDVAVYQTRPVATLSESVRSALASGGIHWITFTSSSTVKNFLAQLGPNAATKLLEVRLASIGPITSQTVREAGMQVVEAQTYNIGGLIKAIVTAEGNAECKMQNAE